MGAPEQSGGAAYPDLRPDPVTMQSATDQSDTVPLVGYLGEGCSDQYVRLYESAALNRWLEIPRAVIVDRVPGPDGNGQSMVRVQRNATLSLCSSVRASDYEGPGPLQPLIWPRP